MPSSPPGHTLRPRLSGGTTRGGFRVHHGHLAFVYFVFAVASLLTAQHYSEEVAVPGESGEWEKYIKHNDLIGPLEVLEDGSVFAVSVTATSLPENSWVFIEAELLDVDKEYLFSFSEELSYFAGRDADGPWTEIRDRFDTKLTIPDAGTYYLKFAVEQERSGGIFWVGIKKLRGTPLPYMVAGITALIIAIILNEVRNRTLVRLLGWLKP